MPATKAKRHPRKPKHARKRGLLDQREMSFVTLYDGNGSETAAKIGIPGSSRAHRQWASRTLAKPAVQQALARKQEIALTMVAAAQATDLLDLMDALNRKGVTTEKIAEVTYEVLHMGDNPKAPRTPLLKALFQLFGPPRGMGGGDGGPMNGTIRFRYEPEWIKAKKLELAAQKELKAGVPPTIDVGPTTS